MPIDASLYANVGRGVKSIQDYAQEQNALDMGNANLMLTRQKADEYTRNVQRQNALRGLAGGWDANTSDEQRVSSMRNQGFHPEADSLETAIAKRLEIRSKTDWKGPRPRRRMPIRMNGC